MLVRKHLRTHLKADIAVEENDDDRRLMTGTIVSTGYDGYKLGETVIFGRYSLYKLTVKGEDYFLLDVADILGTCDYRE